MQTREKILGLGLLLILVAYWGRGALSDWFFKPAQQLQAQISLKQTELAKLEDAANSVLVSTRQLEEWRKTALPESALVAQRLYASWLADLADMCRWTAVTVEPLQTKTISTGISTVQVQVTGTTTVDTLSRFLGLMDGARLSHRVANLNITSKSQVPGSALSVILTAEAVSMSGADRRPLPYAQWRLTDDLPADSLACPVDPPTVRPDDTPFTVTAGDTRLTVVDVFNDGQLWMLKHEDDAPARPKLARGTFVALDDGSMPRTELPATWQAFANRSLFTEAAAKEVRVPKIEVAESYRVQRGDRLELTLRATGFPIGATPAEFSVVGDAPEGLTLDAARARVRWRPDDKIAAGDYPLTIRAATRDETPTVVETKTVLQVREPNSAPVLPRFQTVTLYSGEPWDYSMTGEDRDAPDQTLKYELAGEIPAGLTIEAGSGRLAWTPAMDQEGKTVTVTVKVTDSSETPLSATQDLQLIVSHDPELTTELVGRVEVNGVPTALLVDRQSGVRSAFRQGERITLGRYSGTVSEIRETSVLMETPRGTYVIPLGSTFASRQPI